MVRFPQPAKIKKITASAVLLAMESYSLGSGMAACLAYRTQRIAVGLILNRPRCKGKVHVCPGSVAFSPRVHAHRTACGHRHHRRVDRLTAAGGAESARGG